MTENIRYLNRINELNEDDMRDYITLHRLLEKEMSKPPKEMDLDLIDECFAQIDELVGEGPKHSPMAVQAKITEILDTPTSKTSHIRKKSRPVAAADTKNRHRVRNFFIILAASLVLLYSSLAVAAKVQGYDNTWKFITQKFIEIFNLDSGESLEEDNITLVMEDQVAHYHSIEELLNAEGMNILYPSYIPEYTQLMSVHKYVQGENLKMNFAFTDQNLSITLKNHYTYAPETLIGFEKITNEYCSFYIKDLKNGNYQTFCQFNGYEYSIIYNNYDELIKIINSMEGYIS